MSEKHLFLHVGLHKTGTTAIQEFLSINKEKLQQQSLSYVESDLLLHKSWHIGRYSKDEITPIEELWKPIKKQLAHTSVIYSYEGFSNTIEEQPDFVTDIINFLPKNPIRIIVYLRRQDLHYESFYCQNVKGHNDCRKFNPNPELDHLIHADGTTVQIYDYINWLDNIQNQLRRQDRLEVRLYEKGTFEGGSLFTDFVSSLGIGWDDHYKIPKRSINLNPDGRYVELSRKMASYCQSNKLTDVESALFNNCILNINAVVGRTNNKFLFTLPERRAFLERYEECNRQVAKKYFNSNESLFDTEDLNSPSYDIKDQFEEGELENVLILFHSTWMSIINKSSFRTLNYLRLQYYMKLRKTDRSKRVKFRLFVHKTIQSIGKRFLKNWPNTGLFDAELRSLPMSSSSQESLTKALKAFQRFDLKQ